MDLTINAQHQLLGLGHFLGMADENLGRVLRIFVADESLKDKWMYLEFETPDGQTATTQQLSMIDGVVEYPIPSALMQEGELKVQLVVRDASGLVWKSNVRHFCVASSLNATDDIKESAPDFMTQIHDTLEELSNVTETVEGYAMAEEERVANESQRMQAESDRVDAETTRKNLDLVRSSNEVFRNSSENTRVSNEKQREANEDERETAEQARVVAESDRVDEETKRKNLDLVRSSNEVFRNSAENTRVSNEKQRVTNEDERETAERARVEAEKARVAAEGFRQATYAGLDARLSILETVTQGNLYQTTDATGVAYALTIPENSLPYAKIKQVGGGHVWVDGVMIPLAVTSLKCTSSNGGEDISEVKLPDAVLSLPGYGWGIKQDVYNYIDFENRTFVMKCMPRPYAVGDESLPNVMTDKKTTVYTCSAPATRDLSEMLGDVGFINVQGGGTLTFVNDSQAAVPYSLTYHQKIS